MSEKSADDFSDVFASLRRDGKFRFSREPYRRFEERDDAIQALRALQIKFSDFKHSPRGMDPPDCTCIVDSHLWGVEVTELVHPIAMKMRIAGDRGRHHEWTNPEIILALTERIQEKDRARPKGGPYDRYLLVIRTEEMHLELRRMRLLLSDYSAECGLITDACLAYSYHPRDEDEPGRTDYPAIPIKVVAKA